jgi:hypothetical protein
MTHDKVGPKEAQNRMLQQQRLTKNKALIDKSTKVKAKSIGKITSVKAAKRGGAGRGR